MRINKDKHLLSLPYRILCACKVKLLYTTPALVVLMLLITTHVSALKDFSQHKTNAAMGGQYIEPGGAALYKYEIDEKGNKTKIPVKDAGFTLYKLAEQGEFKQIDVYVTDIDGHIFVKNLTAGEYYWRESYVPEGFLPETEGGQTKKYYFTISSNDSPKAVTIVYNARRKGDLVISKTIKNVHNSPLTDEQIEMSFEFRLFFSTDFEYSCMVEGRPSIKVKNGDKIHLKGGERAEILGLSEGTEYKIVEISKGDFSTVAINDEGVITGEGGLVEFINTFFPENSEYVDISGSKKWVHGDNPVNLRPYSITVIVKAQGQAVAYREVSAAQQWSWSFRLPRYKDGKEIEYTIDEAPLSGYVKTIDGYNIINTYRKKDTPSKQDADNDYIAPDTGQSIDAFVWLVVTVIAFITLIAVQIRKKTEGK